MAVYIIRCNLVPRKFRGGGRSAYRASNAASQGSIGECHVGVQRALFFAGRRPDDTRDVHHNCLYADSLITQSSPR